MLREQGQEQIPVVLLGSKNDLSSQRQVSPDEGLSLAQRLGLPFLEISSRLNFNVSEAVELILEDHRFDRCPATLPSKERFLLLFKEMAAKRKQSTGNSCVAS